MFEKFSSFDQTKASVSTWVYTIARNTLIDFFRTRKVYGELGDEDVVEEDAYQEILNEETLSELAGALEKLPPRERDLIIMHYYNNMQLKEIAVKLHMSYSNCKLVHNKALMKLRKESQKPGRRLFSCPVFCAIWLPVSCPAIADARTCTPWFRVNTASAGNSNSL